MSDWKFTPGPWVHATDLGQVGSIETLDGVVIAQAQQIPGDDAWRTQRTANALLLAAAPELLATLEAMLDTYAELHALYDLGECDATIIARAAIAKAKGEANG